MSFHQIHIASAVTSLLAILLIGGFIRWRSKPEDRKFLLLLFLLELPLAFAAFYLLRMPILDQLFRLIFGTGTEIYGFMRNFYAPLTEEPFKLLPLLIPFIYNKISKENFVMAAMAIGLGFGVGEAWLVGGFISQNSQYAGMPCYYFTGFINERFMVCIMHAGMTAFALNRPWGRLIWGILGAMGLHFIGNFPIYLASKDVFQLGSEMWQVILGLWVFIFFSSMVMLLVYYSMGTVKKFTQFFFGKSVCPGCGNIYRPPLMGLNWFTKRYEKCPGCNKWHWVSLWKKELD